MHHSSRKPYRGEAPIHFREYVRGGDSENAGRFSKGSGGGAVKERAERKKARRPEHQGHATQAPEREQPQGKIDKAKALYGKMVTTMEADGVPRRIAKTAAAIAAATLIPGASVANVTGTIISLLGAPEIGIGMAALPTGLFEAPMIVGGVKLGAKTLNRIRGRVKAMKTEPQPVQQQGQDVARQVAEAMKGMDDEGTITFAIAIGMAMDEGHDIQTAIAVAKKAIDFNGEAPE